MKGLWAESHRQRGGSDSCETDEHTVGFVLFMGFVNKKKKYKIMPDLS